MKLDNNFNSTRPNNSSFHQQTLKGWKPIITTNSLYLPFFAIGIIFVTIGSVLIYYSYQGNELNIDYTNCLNIDGLKCSEVLSQWNYTFYFKSCHCKINLTISKIIMNPVFAYYGLSNFFQNHRRYVKSRDDRQLKGLDVNNELSSDCEPYQYFNITSRIAYAPCGVIANSLFNDSFELKYNYNNSMVLVPWTNQGIAWASETRVRYGRPKSWENTIQPPNWPISAQKRNNNSYSGDEDLIVWMRTAALPTFTKLHRIIQHNVEPFHTGLPRGSYVLSINYSYPVSPFKGSKKLILTSNKNMAIGNPMLGIIYLIIGIIYFVMAIIFVFIEKLASKRQSSETWYIISQNDQSDCPNETFCQVERENNNSEFVDQCISGIHIL